jgi:hypothetical protein
VVPREQDSQGSAMSLLDDSLLELLLDDSLLELLLDDSLLELLLDELLEDSLDELLEDSLEDSLDIESDGIENEEILSSESEDGVLSSDCEEM